MSAPFRPAAAHADQHLPGAGRGVGPLLHDQPPVLDGHRAHAANLVPKGDSVRPRAFSRNPGYGGSAVSGRTPITGGRRPPLWREARIGLETAALLRNPVLRGHGVEDGRGQPVLLIPGFMAGDGSLALMANWLRRTGHRPSRAGMLANVDCSGAAVERLEKRLEKLVREQGKPRRDRRPEPRRRPREGARIAPARPGGRNRHARLAAGGPARRAPAGARSGSRPWRRLGSLGAPGLFKSELHRRRLLRGLLGAPGAARSPGRRLRLGVLEERRRGGLARLPRPGGRPPRGGAHEPLRHGRAPERLARGGRGPAPSSAAATPRSRRARVRLAKRRLGHQDRRPADLPPTAGGRAPRSPPPADGPPPGCAPARWAPGPGTPRRPRG